MKQVLLVRRTALALLVVLFVTAVGSAFAAADPSEPVTAAVATGGMTDRAWTVVAVAATMGIACLAAGYAVAKVGTAALGAAAEKPELMGKALLFVGLAEGIAIYGLIIALFLIQKI